MAGINAADFGGVPIGINPADFGGVPVAKAEPNLGAANKTLARVVGDHLDRFAQTVSGSEATQTIRDIGTVYAPIEATLNAATGLLFGFPAYIGGALGGLASKHLLGYDADPKELAETISRVFTYIPRSEAGTRLAGNVMYPLTKLSEAAEFSGHKVTDVTGSPTAGAITDATIQMLPAPLLGALSRRMAGGTTTNADFQNTAKIIGGDDAIEQMVQNVDASLRATYEKTGIDPFTVMEDAQKNPAVKADLVAPGAEVPMAYVYHGSPHDFTVFDAAKIGTGEGAQAYGHGLYFAENPKVAGDYKASTSEKVFIGKVRDAYDEFESPSEAEKALLESSDLSEPERRLLVALKADDWLGFDYPHQAVSAAIRTPQNFEMSQATHEALAGFGNTYKVQIQQRVLDTMLDWDKPLSEQPKVVKEALERIEVGLSENRMTGAQLQSFMSENNRADGNVTTSDLLKNAGISGIRYLDQGSRKEGKGTSNYVLFDPQHARIIEKNGLPVADADGRIEPTFSEGPLLDTSGPTLDEARAEAPAEQNILELNAGINPASAIRAVRDSYSPYVGVEQPATREGRGILDALQKVIAPASRGPIAETQAGIMRANLGEMAREREVSLENLKDFAAKFDKQSQEQNYAFIDAMEHGREEVPPEYLPASRAIAGLLDQKRDQVQALGRGQLENFYENYFPHIWKDADAASAFYSRRPLTGSGAFLKERTYDTFREGLEAGLQPITNNPVELALLKAREMDRYIYGQRIFQEMRDADLARFVRFGEAAPDGWTKINDKIARVLQYSEPEAGMILRGEYYAPDQAATLLNNHLSPGLQGGAVYDAVRGIGMAMNSLQLGLSAFHVGFTTLDSMVSRVALGVKQMVRGDVLEGAGNVVIGSSPAQPFLNLYKGDKLLRAYLGKLDSPEMAPIVQAIMDAGGRVKMDDFYRNATVNGFKQALRTGDNLKAAKLALPTLLDRLNAPIFEMLVPRQKLGVYFDMAQDWIAKHPDATVEQKRADLGKLWDSVDNRMGQLVYDNVFWNHALKDALLATVRSVGWNLGTFRELGGGIADAASGKFTDRTAYVIALPFLAAIYGATLQYAYTGQGPQELKDYYFPKTGRTRPDGSEDRVSLPTYMKDVYAYGEDLTNFVEFGSNPTQTIQNKAHPLISTISQMLNNEDFYGAIIRNPADPLVQQIQQSAEYLIKQFEPFSLRNYQQQAKLKGEEPSVSGYATSPAMVGITPAPGYMVKGKAELESAAISRLRDPLIKKFRQEIKDGADVNALLPEMLKSGLTRNDIRFIIKTSGETPRPHRLRSFGQEEATQ